MRLRPTLSLKQTQRWLQKATVSPAEPKAVAKRIAPSPSLAPADRVAIYRELYPARLVAALKLDYPLLCQYLGGPVFTQLALLYAAAHPSRSFTLNAFGTRLPEFIGEIEGLRRRDFAVDLATFEQACATVFHEAEAAPLTAEAIAAVPPEGWEHARLQPIPALRLLALRHPVHHYAGGKKSIPRRDSYVAIYRRNYQVAWLPLTSMSHRVLTALSQGKPLGEALTGTRGPAQTWFSDWTTAGLFSVIRRPIVPE